MDQERVQQNVRNAETEDLLDRATVFRSGMEPEALALIDQELSRRGVDAAARAAHEQGRQDLLRGPDGLPLTCRHCHRPAVARAWEWGRFWKLLPLFPRRVPVCREHRPGAHG